MVSCLSYSVCAILCFSLDHFNKIKNYYIGALEWMYMQLQWKK